MNQDTKGSLKMWRMYSKSVDAFLGNDYNSYNMPLAYYEDWAHDVYSFYYE